MRLPFTEAQFLDLFGEYNRALWPAALLLWLLTAAALALPAARRSGRVLAALLGLHWAWCGAAYHLAFFSRINPAARPFAALFLVQAALFLWLAAEGVRFQPELGGSPRRLAAAVLCGYSLIYPVLAAASGLRWPRMPAFAVPCPTTLLTAGLLLALPPGRLRWLAAIPLLWAAVGGSAAVLLGIPPDLALPVAGVLLLAWMLAPKAVPAHG